MSESNENMPSSVSPGLNGFDRLATGVGSFVSRAPFFAAAVGIVLAWLVEGVIRMIAKGPSAFGDQAYQLQINTVTTVVTFLLVALLQNTSARDNEAEQEKLNAIAHGLSSLMDKVASDRHDELTEDIKELRAAVGLEQIVGADDQATGHQTKKGD
jgi:low affinity Fe/Cu permease